NARRRLVQIGIDGAITTEGLEGVLKNWLHRCKELPVDAPDARPGDQLVIDRRAPGGRINQPEERLGKRRLAAAGFSDDADDDRRVAFDVDVDVVERPDLAAAGEATKPVDLVETFGPEDHCHEGAPSRPGICPA